jgi:RimJ/RimL family protein N-acetyltransferase
VSERGPSADGHDAEVADLVPPEPPLRSDRVLLRLFEPSDAADVAASCRDPDIPRFTMMPDGLTEASAAEWIRAGLEWWRRGVARFAITVPPSDRCVGQIGVQFDPEARRAEAFYWLDRRARGQGVATEALDLVTRWALAEHKVRRVQLVTLLDNVASQRVAQRCGFTREGVLRAWEPVKDRQPDVVMWSRVAGDPGLVSRPPGPTPAR